MVNKRKSGHQKRKETEEKFRSNLADRPGQLKISNWFKESFVPGSNSVESNTNDNVTDDSNEDLAQGSFTGNGTLTPDHSNSVESNTNDNVTDDSNEDLAQGSFTGNGTLTPDDSNSVESNTNDNVTDDSNKDSVSTSNGSEEIEHPPFDGAAESIRHEANEAHEKLSLPVLLANNDCLESFTKNASGRKRQFILCKVCRDFEDVARKHSSNQLVPFATGIVVDCQKKLERVVDHLESAQHREATLAKRNRELWEARSERHEWRRYLTKENEYLIQELTKMAVDRD